MNKPAYYQQRIERALALVEDASQTGDWPDLPALASAAALSEYHFHRLYRLMTGETTQQTLARARIGGSLPHLQGPDGIMGGTRASNYASSQSYARAVKALTGATPSQLRSDPSLLASVLDTIVKPGAQEGVLSIEIVELSPVRLICARAVGDYSQLNHGFHRLFELVMEKVAPDRITGLYGIPHDDPRDTPAAQCRFDCAVTVLDAIEANGELSVVPVPARPALRLRHKGDYDQIHEALDGLYSVALILDVELAETLPLHHYHDDPDDKAEEDLLADAYLVLKGD